MPRNSWCFLSVPSELPPGNKNAREEAVKTDHHHTLNLWGGTVAPDCIIDFVWYKGFSSCPVYETITKPYMERQYISDHYPITATLVF